MNGQKHMTSIENFCLKKAFFLAFCISLFNTLFVSQCVTYEEDDDVINVVCVSTTYINDLQTSLSFVIQTKKKSMIENRIDT